MTFSPRDVPLYALESDWLEVGTEIAFLRFLLKCANVQRDALFLGKLQGDFVPSEILKTLQTWVVVKNDVRLLLPPKRIREIFVDSHHIVKVYIDWSIVGVGASSSFIIENSMFYENSDGVKLPFAIVESVLVVFTFNGGTDKPTFLRLRPYLLDLVKKSRPRPSQSDLDLPIVERVVTRMPILPSQCDALGHLNNAEYVSVGHNALTQCGRLSHDAKSPWVVRSFVVSYAASLLPWDEVRCETRCELQRSNNKLLRATVDMFRENEKMAVASFEAFHETEASTPNKL